MEINKNLFSKIIKKEIANTDLMNFALFCMDKIPDYFWVIPASSSGKYHPSTDLGEGGLLRHSLMVARVAIDLFNAEESNSYILTYKEEILFACLFHDCCKNGLKNCGHTIHEHPIIAAEFIEKCYEEYSKIYSLEDLIDIGMIKEMIRRHMGKWTTSKYSDVILSKPMFEEEIFVHKCDYIASRKYCLFDNDFFEKY